MRMENHIKSWKRNKMQNIYGFSGNRLIYLQDIYCIFYFSGSTHISILLYIFQLKCRLHDEFLNKLNYESTTCFKVATSIKMYEIDYHPVFAAIHGICKNLYKSSVKCVLWYSKMLSNIFGRIAL